MDAEGRTTVDQSSSRPGYIQPHALKELWFHTGTRCNLKCSFCLEGSSPEDQRLESLTLADAKPWIDEALALGVQQFSFTGGEPFMAKEMVPILRDALSRAPCQVLTNATAPLLQKMDEVISLHALPFPLRFRVSLDHPDPARHDRIRGEGMFAKSLQTLARLSAAGFQLSVARHAAPNENTAAVNAAYAPYFAEAGLPADLPIVAFPDLMLPGAHPEVPIITEHCMTTYKTEAERQSMMCSFSKMIVKRDGQMRVLPCTLVDDDASYDLGEDLSAAMQRRVMLSHHRCFSCFSSGTSCSES